MFDKQNENVAVNALNAGNSENGKHGACVFQPIIPLIPQSRELPSFPVDALPYAVREYVSAVAEHTQTTPDMAAVIGLGVLAICLQGKFVAEGNPGYAEPLNLYTMLIAPPGERKSGVMRTMTAPLYEYEAEYNRIHAEEVRNNKLQRDALGRRIDMLKRQQETKSDVSIEEQISLLSQQLDEMPLLKKQRFFADDCSSEALTSLMAANGGVFSVISTEGGIFDIMSGRYNSKLNIDVWLKAHCGDTIYVDRKTREAEVIRHPTLSAILTIQPSVLEEVMSNQSMSGRGLLARFLYAIPASRIGTRTFSSPSIPTEVAEAYKGLIDRLMDVPIPEEPTSLILSADAHEMLAQHFDGCERYLAGEGQAIADWAGKYIGAVLRIAGLLHAADLTSDSRLIISERTMSRAIDIGRYFLCHAQYAYATMGGDLAVQKAKFVLAKIRKKGILSVKRSELYQQCRARKFFQKAEDFHATLELLAQHNYLFIHEPSYYGTGRPPDATVYVNPDALKS